MNFLAHHRRPLTSSKSRPSKPPRNLLKFLRGIFLTLQTTVPRSQQHTALATAILLITAAVFLYTGRISNAVFYRRYLDPTHGDPSSAFSPHTRSRLYDAAWRVQQDDGRAAARKETVEIAYFIQVANDSVRLLPRLFARIHHPRNVYVVHIDTKVPASARAEVAELISNSPIYQQNIHLLPSLMITYKAISMVTNTLAGMNLAAEKHKTWDYFINLSGADYPLIAPEDQAALLARPRVPIGRLNFVSFFPQKDWKPYSFRIRNMHWDPAASGYQSATSRLFLLRGFKEHPLEKSRAFVFTKAEAWMILSRPFVEFVLESQFAKRMLVNHLHVLSVPEHYFADILYNHPFWRTTIAPDALRRVVWYLRNRRSGQHPYVLDKGTSIYTFWEYIEEPKCLFARKFSKPDSLLMDKIDAEMSGAGLMKTAARYRIFVDVRRKFLKGTIDFFDTLTKKTLTSQGYKWPNTAYPNA